MAEYLMRNREALEGRFFDTEGIAALLEKYEFYDEDEHKRGSFRDDHGGYVAVCPSKLQYFGLKPELEEELIQMARPAYHTSDEEYSFRGNHSFTLLD